MSALILYTIVSFALLLLWNRFVQPVSLAAALVLFLLPFCFCGRALLTGRIYAPIDLPYMSEPLLAYRSDFGVGNAHNGTLTDLYCQIIPWRKAVRTAYAHGEWPLLNPFMLCGDILAAAAQPAAYDPFNLIGLLIPLAPGLTFAAAMTFFLAGASAFAFARAVGCRELASLVAAAGWMYSASLAFFVGWPLARAWIFLPLILFAVRLVVSEASLRSGVVLTVALVLEILAGHPETLLHVVAIGAVYGVFELATMRRRVGRAIGIAVVSGAIALAVTAIYLLPFLEAAPQTLEHAMRIGVFKHSTFPPMPEVTRRRIGSTFLPFYGGQPWHDSSTSEWDPQTMRVGSVVLALGIAALVLAPRRKETWFLFGLAMVCGWSGADALPVSRILHALPLFDMTLNERLAFAAAFAMSALAAIAVDAWPLDRRRLVVAAIFASVAAALAVATVRVQPEQLRLGVPADLIRTNMLAEIVPLLALAVVAAFRVPPRSAAAVILALLLAQRIVEDGSIYPSLPQRAFYPEIPSTLAIPRDTEEPFRIAGAHFSLIPDTAALYELEDVRGYEAMTNARLAATYPLWCAPQPVSFNAIGDLGRPFLSFLNIRYLLGPSTTLPPPPWRLVMQDKGGKLFENTAVFPRAFVPRRIRYEKSGTKILTAMLKATDFADLAWIEVAEYPPHEIHNGRGRVVARRAKLGLDLDATMDADGWVVVSQTAWKGWRAYLDGRRVQMRYADHAFLGVFVPAGRHRVRLIYLPESFTRGRAISFATLAGLMVVIALRRAATRGKGRAPRPAG